MKPYSEVIDCNIWDMAWYLLNCFFFYSLPSLRKTTCVSFEIDWFRFCEDIDLNSFFSFIWLTSCFELINLTPVGLSVSAIVHTIIQQAQTLVFLKDQTEIVAIFKDVKTWWKACRLRQGCFTNKLVQFITKTGATMLLMPLHNENTFLL